MVDTDVPSRIPPVTAPPGTNNGQPSYGLPIVNIHTTLRCRSPLSLLSEKMAGAVHVATPSWLFLLNRIFLGSQQPSPWLLDSVLVATTWQIATPVLSFFFFSFTLIVQAHLSSLCCTRAPSDGWSYTQGAPTSRQTPSDRKHIPCHAHANTNRTRLGGNVTRAAQCTITHQNTS